MPTNPPTIVWLDTETTSLRHDRRAWEIAAIVRRPGEDDVEYEWLIERAELDLGNADRVSLRFGGYYQRHPQANGAAAGQEGVPYVCDEAEALVDVEFLTRDAVIHGSNPGFDMEVLGARMRANGICPSWYHHPVDVPTLAQGWLLGAGKPLPDSIKSDAISLAVGVDPAGYDRHSALGDCRWLRDLYDAVTGNTTTTEGDPQ